MAMTKSENLKPTEVNGQPTAPAEEQSAPVAPSTPVAAPVEPPKAEETNPKYDYVELELMHQFTNNWTPAEAAQHGVANYVNLKTGAAQFGPGKVRVPRDIAADLQERQMAVYKSEQERMDGINGIHTISGFKPKNANLGELQG